MTNAWMEWAIIAFIVGTIAWIVWKGGAANPMGTGQLSRKLGKLAGEVSTLAGRLHQTERELAELKLEAATTKDIERLEARMEGQRQLSERTNRGVERIETLLLEKAVNGK